MASNMSFNSGELSSKGGNVIDMLSDEDEEDDSPSYQPYKR